MLSMVSPPFCVLSLTNIIQTSPRVRLVGSGNILLIDGRQPICFIKSCLNQPSIPLGSQISAPPGCSEARRSFADGLCALQEAITRHSGCPVVQERVWIILVRLRDSENHCTGKIPGKPTKIRSFRNFFQGKTSVGNFVKKGFTFSGIYSMIIPNRVGNLA